MAKSPQREAFKPAYRQELATDEFPDMVSIDLDGKNPNEFTIVEVDDTPEEDRGRSDTDPANWNDANSKDPEGVSPRTEKRIGRLKAETETQRRLREAAERERDAAVELARGQAAELADLRKRAESGTAALASSMKAEREARLSDAKRRLEQAHTDGDSAAIAAATADMGMAQAELVQIAARTPAPRTEQERQPAPQSRVADQPLHPNARAWIERHPEFNTDKVFRARATSAHYAAEADGVYPSSPEYGETLDKYLKNEYAEKREPENGSREGEGRSTPRRTNAVAEGGREAPGQNRNPRTVELTSSQLAIAKQLNLTPQQYAASVLKLQRNGAL